jgi:UDP-N-acetylmuramoyl-L-alanyl-D-glutamate--2,6-diaminopimelate ligase
LDYHDSFNDYIATKKRFFDVLDANTVSIINADDKYGASIVLDTESRKVFFSIKNPSHYKALILEQNLSGLSIQINNTPLDTNLVGEFNAYNLLATYAVALELNQDKLEVSRCLSCLDIVPGRFNIIQSESNIIGVVDYAHTPDALKQVIKSISQFCVVEKDLIIVIGCGGNRDVGKRSIMGKIAAQNSKLSIFTSDNPRLEDPELILDHMCSDVGKKIKNKIHRVINREDAISFAVNSASKGQIILVAGKGHEKFQDANGKKKPFDDFEILKKLLKI